MKPGESVVYQEKACVVLDADQEGFHLPQEHVLLEELAYYSVIRGRVRHLVHLGDIDKFVCESPQSSPST